MYDVSHNVYWSAIKLMINLCGRYCFQCLWQLFVQKQINDYGELVSNKLINKQQEEQPNLPLLLT